MPRPGRRASSLPLCRAGSAGMSRCRDAALVLLSLPGAVLGFFLLRLLPVALLRRAFGGFLVVLAFAGLRGMKKQRPD